MRVKVYYSEAKKKLSVIGLDGIDKDKVICHVNCISLINVEFKIDQAAKANFLKNKDKAAYAYVVGTLTSFIGGFKRRVTFNAYRYNTFVYEDKLSSVYAAKAVTLVDNRIFV